MDKAKEIFDLIYALIIKLSINLKYFATEIWLGLKFFGTAFIDTVKGFL